MIIHRIASEQLKPLNGLEEVCKWIEDRGLKRAAVTNAPRPNAELIISMLGLSDFFELLIIGSECERAKPFPDPYLKALQELGVSPKHAFVFEVWNTHRNLMVNVHKRKLLENNNMFLTFSLSLFPLEQDSISGIKAGVAAGMPVVGLGLRNPEKLLSEAGATFVIKDFNDSKLWTALEELEPEIHA